MLRGWERWGWGYLRQRMRMIGAARPSHFVLCVADHFEPFGREIQPDGSITGGGNVDMALQHVLAWCKAYRKTVADLQDDDGRPPQHTFFYPWDEYHPKIVDAVGLFCKKGYGEVEVHLHHRSDTAAGLTERLHNCRKTYAHEHGLLGRNARHEPAYAFVHGNWALCNSRPGGDWCGVNQEIAVLRNTGCFMDCTFPSAPSPTQPAFVNLPYYGTDPEEGQNGHRFVCAVRKGGEAPGDSLLMLPGPLGICAPERGRIRPRLENAELTQQHPATWERYRFWRRLQIHVAGAPDWVFVKLHTHGLDSLSRAGVVGETARSFHAQLRAWCHADGLQLHYATAREMYNMIKAAEAGHVGNPHAWRDFAIAPPP